MVEADAPFIEHTRHRLIVSHYVHDDTRGAEQGPDIEAGAADVVYLSEAHDVLPQTAACSQSGTVNSICEIPLSLAGIPRDSYPADTTDSPRSLRSSPAGISCPRIRCEITAVMPSSRMVTPYSASATSIVGFWWVITSS